jgi:glucosamine-6-phosphate deaminase
MEVVICASYEEMSAAAAGMVAKVVRAKPDAVLGLATGGTPKGLYQELIKLHKNMGLDFSQITTFNLDEYVGLAGDHKQSYRYFMNENLFNHINVRPGSTNVPSGLAEDYTAHCQWYEDRIEARGGIDLQVLGIGTDGHIAFNEPGSSLAGRTRIKTLAKQTIDDNKVYFGPGEKFPIYAVTMGVGTILEARKLLLVANGEKKAQAVADCVEGPVSAWCTASALQLHPDATIFVDRPAAGKLKMREYYEWIQANKPGAPKR